MTHRAHVTLSPPFLSNGAGVDCMSSLASRCQHRIAFFLKWITVFLKRNQQCTRIAPPVPWWTIAGKVVSNKFVFNSILSLSLFFLPIIHSSDGSLKWNQKCAIRESRPRYEGRGSNFRFLKVSPLVCSRPLLLLPVYELLETSWHIISIEKWVLSPSRHQPQLTFERQVSTLAIAPSTAWGRDRLLGGYRFQTMSYYSREPAHCM